MHLDSLYPKVKFPVSRGTPMIGPLVKLNHSIPRKIEMIDSTRYISKRQLHVNIGIRQKETSSVIGHIIDGRNLLPATGYLFAVLTTISRRCNLPIELMNVVFENLKFIRALNIPKDDLVKLVVTNFQHSGEFEVQFQN